MEEQTTFNEDTMEEILGSIVENEEDADEDENE